MIANVLVTKPIFRAIYPFSVEIEIIKNENYKLLFFIYMDDIVSFTMLMLICEIRNCQTDHRALYFFRVILPSQ